MTTTEALIRRGHELVVDAARTAANLRRSNFIAAANPIELELLHARLDNLADYDYALMEYERSR